MAIVKQGMSDCPGNNGEMTSQKNFKPRFSSRSLDLVRRFLSQFGVILEVWLPGVRRNVALTGQRKKNDVTENFKLRVLRGLWI